MDKQELADLIPHAGLMCLNEGVISWDELTAVCVTDTHQKGNNPLIKDGKLSCLHAIEYCAQVMAVHGGLLAREKGEKLAPGYLAAIRDVSLTHDYLDDIKESLYVSVKQLMAQAGNLMYEFLMYYGEEDNKVTVASGRATVIQMVK